MRQGDGKQELKVLWVVVYALRIQIIHPFLSVHSVEILEFIVDSINLCITRCDASTHHHHPEVPRLHPQA